MQYDKRKLERLDIFLIVEFKPLQSMGGGTTGITRDLTTAGFSMEAQSIDCNSGDVLEFRLKHPGGHQELVLSGEVVWKNHSWYKYVIGVKFLEVNKEQRTGILKLMSGVKDVTSAAGPSDDDAVNVSETEKRNDSEGNEESEKTDEPGPDTPEISSEDDLAPSADEEPEVRGEDSTAGDGAGKADIKNSASDAAGVICDNVSSSEEGQKKKFWLYVPLAAAVIVILLIALPAMIEKINHTPESRDVLFPGSGSHNSREAVISMPEADSIKGHDEVLNLPEPELVKDKDKSVSTDEDALKSVSGDLSAENKMSEQKMEEPSLPEEDHSTSGSEQRASGEDKKESRSLMKSHP